MSQYTIDYSCGHSGSKNICGKQSERQGKADWYAQGVCEDCYKAKKQAERDETNKVAAEELKGFDLPVLV